MPQAPYTRVSRIAPPRPPAVGWASIPIVSTVPPRETDWEIIEGHQNGLTYTPLRLAGGTTSLRRRYTAIWP